MPKEQVLGCFKCDETCKHVYRLNKDFTTNFFPHGWAMAVWALAFLAVPPATVVAFIFLVAIWWFDKDWYCTKCGAKQPRWLSGKG